MKEFAILIRLCQVWYNPYTNKIENCKGINIFKKHSAEL